MDANMEFAEDEIVLRAQRGDEPVFEQIYCKHRRRVYSVCMRSTHNPAEAEALTQTIFLQLYRKIGSFRGDSSLWTWLYRVTLNIVLMSARRKQIVCTAVYDCTDVEQSTTHFARDDVLLASTVNRITLMTAIESLPPGYRMVLWLHDMLGYEHDEIAEMLGCSSGNTKSQLHKVRLKMRAQLLERPSQSLPIRLQSDPPTAQNSSVSFTKAANPGRNLRYRRIHGCYPPAFHSMH